MDPICDYIGNDFGASYPDSICINGFLWDMDSGYSDEDGWIYTIGGDVRCPKCNPFNMDEYLQEFREENQAVIEYDHFQCNDCGEIHFDDGFQICECGL